MKYISINVLFTLLISTVAMANAERNCFTLPDGTSGCEPFIVSDANQLSVFGTADPKPIADELSPFGLKPIIVNGSAIVALEHIQYAQTSIGPYTEFIVMYPVRTDDFRLTFYSIPDFLLYVVGYRQDPKHPNLGFYMKHLVLDGEDQVVDLAIRGGREGYGIPKERGRFHTNELLGNKLAAAIRFDSFRQEKAYSFSLEVENSIWNNIRLPTTTTQFQVATGLGKPIWTISKARMNTSSFILANSMFGSAVSYSGNGPIRDLLDLIKFEPQYWSFADSVSFEFSTASRPKD